VDYANRVKADNEAAYNRQIELAQKAGKPIIATDKANLDKALSEAMAEAIAQAEAEAQKKAEAKDSKKAPVTA